MTKLALPIAIKDGILQGTLQRDITTARRAALLEILWNERYLARSQLIARLELQLVGDLRHSLLHPYHL